MNSTSTVQFANNIPKLFFSSFDEGMKKVARMLWGSSLAFLSEYWLAVMLTIFVILIVATFKAMLGHWGALGSLLYNLFYFGFIGTLVWIYGLEIFFNSYFDLLCFIIYVVSYYLVGLILKKFR